MRKIIYDNPPVGALGLMVWPSDTLPGYQITAPELYRPNHPRKLGLARVDLLAAIESAQASLQEAPDIYAIWVAVE